MSESPVSSAISSIIKELDEISKRIKKVSDKEEQNRRLVVLSYILFIVDILLTAAVTVVAIVAFSHSDSNSSLLTQLHTAQAQIVKLQETQTKTNLQQCNQNNTARMYDYMFLTTLLNEFVQPSTNLTPKKSGEVTYLRMLASKKDAQRNCVAIYGK